MSVLGAASWPEGSAVDRLRSTDPDDQAPSVDPVGIRRVVMPAYLARFECIGPACEDTCCSGFGIPVDAITFGRLSRVADPEIAPLVRAHVLPNADFAPALGGAYASIQMQEDGDCPFLDAERLCAIQTKLGERYLFYACDTYPRMMRFVDGTAQVGATLGCPEAARLALLDPDAMALVEVADEPRVERTRRRGLGMLRTDRLAADDRLRSLPVMRPAVFDLLRRRNVSLEARLLALGHTLDELSEQPLSAEAVQAAFARQVDSLDAFERRVAAATPSYAGRLALLREIIALRLASGRVGTRYRDCLARVVAGLGVSPAEERVRVSVRRAYAAADRTFLRPYLAEKPHVLENAILNYAYWTDFPYTQGFSFLEDYSLLVLHHAMLTLHLVGVAAHEGRLSDELVVFAIQSTERDTTGSLPLRALALEHLKQKNLVNLPALTDVLLG